MSEFETGLRTGHDCAVAGCGTPARQIIVEGHPFAMLFKQTGAALVCDKHARECERIGGVRIPLEQLEGVRGL